jgi:uncharacterized membrane protein (UPF0127 family)
MDFDCLRVGKHIFNTSCAITNQEQERGLMWQKNPQIMTFVYSSPSINKFWMQNTFLPLNILFCKSGKVLDIQYGEPLSTKIIGHDILSDLIIEMPYGYCEKYDIGVNSEVELFYGEDTIKKLAKYFNFSDLRKL